MQYEIREIGNPPGNKYIKKYVVDLDVIPKITEIRIYADKDGRIHVPAEYRSDVTYGADVKALAVALYSEGGNVKRPDCSIPECSQWGYPGTV